MARLPLFLTLFCLLAARPSGSSSAQSGMVLLSPVDGQVLQGTVAIQGSTGLENFQSAELAFAYSGDTSGAWFPIAALEEPVAGGLLAQWDTSTISDGEYALRLVVTFTDGSQETATVSRLQVRNYSPVETPAGTAQGAPAENPAAALTESAPAGTATVLPAQATPLPMNPAQVTRQDLNSSLGKGILAAVGVFALLGIYQILKESRDSAP
jgi:hypothetical protein